MSGKVMTSKHGGCIYHCITEESNILEGKVTSSTTTG